MASSDSAKQHPEAPPPVVTLAALYGAGGSAVGPRVADRLGVPFLYRAIPEAVAKEAGLSDHAVEDLDEKPRGTTTHVMDTLGRVATVGGKRGLGRQPRSARGATARLHRGVLADAAASGGVALGRGGMVVLREVPWALHVYLGGRLEARIEQAMRTHGVDREQAEREQELEDRARIEYVRRA